MTDCSDPLHGSPVLLRDGRRTPSCGATVPDRTSCSPGMVAARVATLARGAARIGAFALSLLPMKADLPASALADIETVKADIFPDVLSGLIRHVRRAWRSAV